MFESPAFQPFEEDVMTIVQEMGEKPLTRGSLVLVMLRSAEGDQVAAFVALIMRYKMELVWEQ